MMKQDEQEEVFSEQDEISSCEILNLFDTFNFNNIFYQIECI